MTKTLFTISCTVLLIAIMTGLSIMVYQQATTAIDCYKRKMFGDAVGNAALGLAILGVLLLALTGMSILLESK